MIYKWYVNNDFRLLVKTQLFLTMDMYVMTFKNSNSEFFYNELSSNLFSNDQDIDVMNYWYNPVKILDAVKSISDKTEQDIHVGKKNYTKINITSHNDIYNMTFNEDIKDVFIVQIKRFDKDNYISPVCIRVDEEQLKEYNHNLDLSALLQERSNIKLINNLLSDFRKAIFI